MRESEGEREGERGREGVREGGREREEGRGGGPFSHLPRLTLYVGKTFLLNQILQSQHKEIPVANEQVSFTYDIIMCNFLFLFPFHLFSHYVHSYGLSSRGQSTWQ